MKSNTNISLNLQMPNFSVVVYAVQGDVMTREITASLYDGQTAFTPPVGALGTIRFLKPDGTSGFYDTLEDEETVAVTWEDNIATIKLAEQVLTVAGEVIVQLSFYNADAERLSAFNFKLVVEKNPLTDEQFESTDYYSVLTARIAAVLGAVAHAPQINELGHWVLWDEEEQDYYDSGVDATGPQGETGPRGYAVGDVVLKSGTGSPGTTDVYAMKLNDTSRTEIGTFNVYNGSDGEGAPGTQTPQMDGTGSAGSANAYAREDHVHPKDTSKANSADVGDVSSLSGFTAATVVGALNELKTAQVISSGTVTYDYAISAGHVRAYRIGKVVLVKIYINFNANLAQNAVMAKLPWSPNDIYFSVIENSTSGDQLVVQINSDKTLTVRSAVLSGSWLIGELVYFTND